MERKLLGTICFLLLVCQLFLQVRLAKLDSQTTDEAVHLSAGYSYVTKGDFRFNPEHPPLVKALAALPLLFVHVNQPSDFSTTWEKSGNFFYDSWKENRRYGEQLLYESGNNPDQLLFLARLPMAGLTFLLGLILFLIAFKHWGPRSALVATALYVFNPIVTAHGHLITTDIALSLAYIVTAYTSWKFFSEPTNKNAIWLGLSIGLALISKHTAIIILPVLFLIAAGYVWQRHDYHFSKQVVKNGLLSLLVVWVVIWAGYGFHDRVLPSSAHPSQEVVVAHEEAIAISGADPVAVQTKYQDADRGYQLIRYPLMLLPGDYVKGVFLVLTHVNNGQDSYLLGQFSSRGWWYYFPFLSLVKTPLGELLVLVSALVIFFRAKPRSPLVVVAVIFSGLFLLFAMSSKANLGVRHVLPIFPPLFLLAAWATSLSKKIQIVFGLLLVWAGIAMISAFPSYIGYYNELVLGSNNGYHIATDSNLDWGQDVLRIRDYIADNQLQQPYLVYDWLGQSALHHYLGNNFRRTDQQTPTSGDTVIIGASAFVNPNYSYLRTNADCGFITPGTLHCTIR